MGLLNFLSNIFMPHRLFINHALRKASDGLKERLDNYEVEFNSNMQAITAKLEKEKKKKNNEFASMQKNFLSELEKDKKIFDVVKKKLMEYIDRYVPCQILYRVRNIKYNERQLLFDKGDFLSEQINLINEEIDLLEKRKDQLSGEINIEDCLILLKLNAHALSNIETNDARSLLDEINRQYNESNAITKSVLNKLRVILQEKIELINVIDYISWTIGQKKQSARRIVSERRDNNNAKNIINNEIENIDGQIQDINKSLKSMADKIHDIWEEPIWELSRKIDLKIKEREAKFKEAKKKQQSLNSIFEKINEINAKLNQIRNARTNDSRWDMLQNAKTTEKNRISSAKNACDTIQSSIDKLNSEINMLWAERDKWNERRNMIYSLCKQNGIYGLLPAKGDKS